MSHHFLGGGTEGQLQYLPIYCLLQPTDMRNHHLLWHGLMYPKDYRAVLYTPMLTEAGTVKQAHVRGQMGAKWTVHALVRELQAPPCGNRAPEGLLFGFF